MTDLLTVRSGKTIDPDAHYTPCAAVITDVEKRRGISKYYVYIIEVTTQGNLKYNVYRRYAQFFEMHQNLTDSCTSEQAKSIPLLPPKIYFGRSAVREVATERMPLLNDFLNRLISKPDLLRKGCVRDFLMQSIDDGKPYEFQNPILKSPVQSRKGSSEIVKALTPKINIARSNPAMSAPKTGPRALVLFEYFATNQEELTLMVGKTIELIRHVDSLWLEGKYLGKQGIFPANYVRIIEPLDKGMDEFDFSDEWDDEDEETFFTVFYKGVPRQIEIDPSKVQSPSYQDLITKVRGKLRVTDVVLNFRDREGDLVAILDDSDIRIMLSESFYNPNNKKYNCTSWALYVTKHGDYSQYNIDPYN
ncbi:hypothetical protein LOD99_3756 [Oopsacas minuta]|uniref:Uncharacterized protein n=1 Tax=Oopsacas minuta TaxID=111878 RepID=A0AAV7JYZ5_9METZ|nr:hypothetical protein LOD99_3756 [Oopsacas minuta]